MQDCDLRIQAGHGDLAELKEALYAAVPGVDVQEDPDLRVGQHGEPILIGLIVALGGATLTREVFRTIRHWMDQRTKEKKLDTIKFYLEGADGSRDVTLEQLMTMVG